MKLYPRLARRFAHDEFTKQAALGLRELAESADTTHPLMTWPATGAARVTPQELANLRTDILAAAEDHGWPEPLSQDLQRTFDLTLARILWDHAELSPAEAGFGDVWSFLALVLVPDVVWWRAGASTNVERLVATDLTRHTLARLWWRALLFTHGLDDPEQGWELWRSSEIGEADLDQIQTRRGGYGRSPKVFRAVVRLYPLFTELAAASGVERRRLWRDQYLRWLLRLGAFTDFSGLPEDEVNEDLEALARQLEPAAAQPTEGDEESQPLEEIVGVREFDALPLRMVVVHLAHAVRSSGELADDELSDAFERAAGITVPAGRREILNGIAWQGVPLHYLAHEGEPGASKWRPGTVLPAPDRRWGDWSIDSFKAHVAATNGEADREALAAELFAGRAGRTVRRIVRAAIQEANPRQP
jgi:hypothetical protein